MLPMNILLKQKTQGMWLLHIVSLGCLVQMNSCTFPPILSHAHTLALKVMQYIFPRISQAGYLYQNKIDGCNKLMSHR